VRSRKLKYLECGTDPRPHILLRLDISVVVPSSVFIWPWYSLNLNAGTNSPGADTRYSIEIFSEVMLSVCSQDRIINSMSYRLCVNISLHFFL
jgi:hypothetical protein